MSYYIKHDDPTRLKNIKKLIDERDELFKKYQKIFKTINKTVDTR